MIRFKFDEVRAAQAVGVLLREAGGRENYTKLLKILYLADREALRVTGASITGDTFVQMSNGPVLSNTYDQIKRVGRQGFWQRYIKRDTFDVRLEGDPGDGELSDFDVETLRRLYRQYEHYDHKAMVEIVHSLPEWRDPGKRCQAPLSMEEVLAGMELSESEIREYQELHEYQSAVEAFFETTA